MLVAVVMSLNSSLEYILKLKLFKYRFNLSFRIFRYTKHFMNQNMQKDCLIIYHKHYMTSWIRMTFIQEIRYYIGLTSNTKQVAPSWHLGYFFWNSSMNVPVRWNDFLPLFIGLSTYILKDKCKDNYGIIFKTMNPCNVY